MAGDPKVAMKYDLERRRWCVHAFYSYGHLCLQPPLIAGSQKVFLFCFVLREREKQGGEGQRDREGILSRLHAQHGVRHRAPSHHRNQDSDAKLSHPGALISSLLEEK